MKGFARLEVKPSPWRRIGFALAFAALAGAATPVAADIYKRVDSDGIVHFSDRSMGEGSVLIVRGSAARARATARRPTNGRANRARYGPMIDRVARQLSLDEALVHAVVRAESAYDPLAVSRAGAVGLMQLMPATAERYGVRDRRDPTQNLYGGVRYLRDLIRRFDNVVLALAAYNAGENAVTRHGNKVPPFPETRQYVRRVLTFYRELRPRS